MNLKEQIEKYEPYNEQEAKDKETMLKYINTFDDVLTRNNEFGHFTASSWVVNKERTKVLMIYHNIYKSWSWTGGHADGESDLLQTAIRELKEETGLDVVVNSLIGIYTDSDMRYPNGDQAHSICIVYELKKIGGKLKCDNLETLELKYFDVDELPVMFCKQHEEIKVDLINKYGRG